MRIFRGIGAGIRFENEWETKYKARRNIKKFKEAGRKKDN
jgi:hypothetical protein